MEGQNKLFKFMEKTIVTLSLLLVFLISCFGIVIILFAGIWLHTYNAFTSKKLVATIEVTPLTQDERGFDRFKVVYKQLEGTSALVKLLFPNQTQQDSNNITEQTFTMFGDTVFIEAHIVKLPDFFTLINFKAIYKITGIEGDFVNDKEKAKTLPSSERSLYDLNGGVDETWKWIKNNELGLQFIIDTAEISKQGKDVGSRTLKWGVYITEEGILLDLID